MNAEQQRLDEANKSSTPWRRWGPYLSERQWGTVREDYSDDGNAWEYFSHDQARSRAYRRGEDGLAGISDDRQRLYAVMHANISCSQTLARKRRRYGIALCWVIHGDLRPADARARTTSGTSACRG